MSEETKHTEPLTTPEAAASGSATDTPKTDALCRLHKGLNAQCCADALILSGSLERELDAANAESARLRNCWESDSNIFRGALQLLKEAGMAPGSRELIAAANRAQNATSATPGKPHQQP